MATQPFEFRFVVPSLFLLALLLTACQGDREKAAEHLAKAETYAQQGQLDQAVLEFQGALRVDGALAAAHLGLGQAYLQLGQWSHAFLEFDEAVRLDPSDSQARVMLARSALLERDPEKALEQAQVAVELTPDDANAYAVLAQALELSARPNEAEASYLRAIAKEPEEAEFLLLIAGYYERRGDRAAAHAMLVNATELDPDFTSFTLLARFLSTDPARDEETVEALERAMELAKGRERVAAHRSLSDLHASRGRMDAANETLEAGIGLLEDDPDGRHELVSALVRLHSRQGNMQAAVSLIESALSDWPDDVGLHLALSEYRGRQGDGGGALAAAEQAVKADPAHQIALLRKAELLVEAGYRSGDSSRIEESRQIVDAVLGKEPGNPDGLLVLSKIAYAENDLEAAVEALEAATEAKPDWAGGQLALAIALERSGKARAARAHAARALELAPQLPEARLLLAEVHASLGEYGYAVEQGRLYLRQRPDDVSAQILLAESLGRIGRHEEAIETVERIPEDRWTVEVLLTSGRLHLAAGELERSREMLLRVNEAKPLDPQTLRLLMQVEALLGELDESGARIDQALAARPSDGELVRLKGSYAKQRGDVDAAAEAFERAIELNPDDDAAYRELASIYQASGRLDEALETFERALEARPDSAQLQNFVAVLNDMKGEKDAARRGFERAIELDPSMAQPKNNLAYLLAESGSDLDRAIDLAQQAAAMMPGSSVAADTLGWVLYKRGQAQAAAGYFREAIAGMDPDAPELALVRHHLALAYEAYGQREKAIEALELALGELEQQQGEIRKRGGKPLDPAWARPARTLHARLKQAG